MFMLCLYGYINSDNIKGLYRRLISFGSSSSLDFKAIILYYRYDLLIAMAGCYGFLRSASCLSRARPSMPVTCTLRKLSALLCIVPRAPL